jgi:5-formyltetrahydrofolate cyclo-ligase
VDFDPDYTAEVSRQAKQALRRRMRSLRRALPDASVERRSQRLVARLETLDELASAATVGMYWPMEQRGEVDVRPLDAWLREHQRQVYYPFMDDIPGGVRTGFRLVNDPRELAPRGHRFAEPPPDAAEAHPASLDLVVVPALAADSRGYRLGHGSGFYDVTLPEHCPPGIAVIVVYHFQLLAELPLESHDHRAGLVVTDEATLRTA